MSSTTGGTDPHNSFARALHGLKTYWFLVVLVVSGIYSWSQNSYKLEVAQRELDAVRDLASRLELKINRINQHDARINLLQYRVEQLERRSKPSPR